MYLALKYSWKNTLRLEYYKFNMYIFEKKILFKIIYHAYT